MYLVNDRSWLYAKPDYQSFLKISIGLLLILVALPAISQTTDLPDITADRPGMSTPPSIVGAKSIQFESGFSFEKITSGNTVQENILYNTTLVRYGINKYAEIRLQTDYAQEKTDSTNLIGLNPLTLGTKILVAKGNKILPFTSLFVNLTLPWVGNKNFRPGNLAPSFYLLMQNNITDKLNLCYNIGIQYDGFTSIASKFAAICLGYNFTEKLSGFLENYNWFSRNTDGANFIDGGFAYLVSKNLQLDLSGNLNLRDFRNYYMTNFGVSWRLPNNSRK